MGEDKEDKNLIMELLNWMYEKKQIIQILLFF